MMPMRPGRSPAQPAQQRQRGARASRRKAPAGSRPSGCLGGRGCLSDGIGPGWGRPGPPYPGRTAAGPAPRSNRAARRKHEGLPSYPCKGPGPNSPSCARLPLGAEASRSARPVQIAPPGSCIRPGTASAVTARLSAPTPGDMALCPVIVRSPSRLSTWSLHSEGEPAGCFSTRYLLRSPTPADVRVHWPRVTSVFR
jgi:hypothetical protein